MSQATIRLYTLNHMLYNVYIYSIRIGEVQFSTDTSDTSEMDRMDRIKDLVQFMENS